MPANSLLIFSSTAPIKLRVSPPPKPDEDRSMCVIEIGDIDISIFRKLDTLLDFGYAIIRECRKLQPAVPNADAEPGGEILDSSTGNSASHDLGEPVG